MAVLIILIKGWPNEDDTGVIESSISFGLKLSCALSDSHRILLKCFLRVVDGSRLARGDDSRKKLLSSFGPGLTR